MLFHDSQLKHIVMFDINFLQNFISFSQLSMQFNYWFFQLG